MTRIARRDAVIRPGDRVRTKAPLRLGLAGGGTDLSPYCETYGGAVLNVTIDRYAFASLQITEGDSVFIGASDLDKAEEVPVGELSTTGPLALHRAVYNRIVRDFCNGQPFGARITTMIDAPPGSGLGSSSALVVALVDTFRAALQLPLGRYDVAHLAFEIERIDLSLAGGRQDQYAASFGGINFMEFLAEDRVIVNPLRVPSMTRNELEASIIICFTGHSRASETIIREQVAAITAVDKLSALDGMHQLKADALEMKLALLHGDISQMGRILDRSWAAKKSTAHSVSTPMIDELWSVAHANGALAGKISGAGGGGFMMFIVDPDERARVIRALNKSGGTASGISFTTKGVESWSY